MAKLTLTAQQQAAYEPLLAALKTIAKLDACDRENLLAWLDGAWGSFHGPVGLEPVLHVACAAAIKAVDEHDEREWPDPTSFWESQIHARFAP